MKPAEEFVTELRREGISLWLEGGQLRYKAAAGLLTSGKLADIRAEKQGIIDFLRRGADCSPAKGLLVSRGQAGRLKISYSQESYVRGYDSLSTPQMFHLPLILRLSGSLNVGALKFSIDKLIERQSILRTRFSTTPDGKAYATLAERIGLDITTLDLSNAHRDTRDRRVRKFFFAFSKPRFNLESGPMLRAALLKIEAQEHLLILIFHHAIFDAWSNGIVIADISSLYEAAVFSKEPSLPKLGIQFYDFAQWQRECAERNADDLHVEYWKTRFQNAYAPFWLPPDEEIPSKWKRKGLKISPVHHAIMIQHALLENAPCKSCKRALVSDLGCALHSRVRRPVNSALSWHSSGLESRFCSVMD